MSGKNPESKLVEQALDLLFEEFPGYWMKNHGNIFQVSGRPDVEGVTQAIPVCIEFKKPGVDDIPDLQVSYLEDFANAGGLAIGPVNSLTQLRDELYKGIRLHKVRNGQQENFTPKGTLILKGKIF